MQQIIMLEDIKIHVERKKMKNMYLRILPPDGTVKITAPNQMPEEEIIRFAMSRMSWITDTIQKVKSTPHSQEKQYISGEYHYLWGRRYLLEVKESEIGSRVCIDGDRIVMRVLKTSTLEQRQAVLELWYRNQLKAALPAVTKKCIQVVGKEPYEWRIKNMKTKWGTCNITQKRIWLNLQLATKSPECLSYVVTHELVHLYVRYHNDEFKTYMDRFFPNWREVKKHLNQPFPD